MITTYGAGRDRLVRSNQCASLYAENTRGGISPLLAVCHEAALAPEEGGVPACGEDRRVASGAEGAPTSCMKASMVCVEEVAAAQNGATVARNDMPMPRTVHRTALFKRRDGCILLPKSLCGQHR